MMRGAIIFGALLCVVATAQRIDHAGRILGDLQVPSAPILFNTPQADQILTTMQICPRTSAWNEVIENRPLLSNSAAMIAMIRSELASNRRNLRAFYEMNFVLVPVSQPLVPIDFVTYPDESDPGPYPIPTNMPIELWPVNTEGQTLDQWQRDALGWGGDRHGLIVQPGNGNLFETWQMKKLSTGAWQASNGAKFDLNSNALRPLGWTSGDAAGLAMFPALVRYDEVQRGSIEHAVRLVVKHTRREYIYPATHHASNPSTTDPNVPAMGQRLRLKASFVIPSTWTPEAKCVARAMKKYGCIVADNGNFFQISVTPDDRWPVGAFDNLWDIDVNQFEVVQTTGANEGPRSPNPPVANAGADRSGQVGAPVALPGATSGGTGQVSTLWTKYSGPGSVTFANPASASTSATFSAAGAYTLMLRASDAVHTPGFDAVVVTVTSGGAISNLTMTPNPVDGGYQATGTVTLALPAPSGGATVAITDTLSMLTPPATVVVPQGQTARSFSVAASVVNTAYVGNLIASYSGAQRVLSVTVQPGPAIQNLTLTPSAVTGGASSTGRVTLNKPAPTGGTTVSLTDSSAAVSMKATVKIPAGSTDIAFLVSTTPVASTLNANVTAAVPGSALGATLAVRTAALAAVAITPSTVTGGASATGTLTLNGVAAQGGASASLSDNSASASVPATIVIPQGQTSSQFTVATSAVASTAVATISASRLGVVRTTTLTIVP